MNKLIDLIQNGDEPLKTHALKCIQVFVYNDNQMDPYYPRLRELLDLLIKNVMVCIDADPDGMLVSVEPADDPTNDYVDDFERSLIHMREIGRKQLDVPVVTLKDLVDQGIISKASQQKFHYMALIYCLIQIYHPSEFIDNEELFKLLYHCLNVTKVKSDAVVAVSLEIIYEFMDDSAMFNKFIKDDILYRVLSVPYYNTFKISENQSYLQNIYESDKNLIKIIIDYIIHASKKCFDDNLPVALINFMKYSTIDDLNEIKGFQTVIESSRDSTFIKLRDVNLKITDVK
ncbi:hypothetical protein RF11_12360 [Thelohanellus kitauei]|uniref:Uncharacterized protein n=1 Tax=Thelohanellus kitauei TaxID=669202 RepID=A0A0C2JU23_THEKT|nr:hypothetical protein RF11_12360 [Thelohanellus kitauei]